MLPECFAVFAACVAVGGGRLGAAAARRGRRDRAALFILQYTLDRRGYIKP